MKRFIMLVLSAFIFALMASCDGAGSSDGEITENFKTVRVYAAYGTEAYTADVAEREDTDNDDICDTISYFEDDIFVTISSIVKEFLPAHVVPSPLKCLDYTVDFIAHEDSPDVATETINHHVEIAPGSSTTMSLRIIDQEDKSWFSTHPLNHFDYSNWSLATGGASYEYTIEVAIRCVEVLTGHEETIEFDFPLFYFDVAEDCIVP